MRLEGFGKLKKKSNDFIGTRIRDIPDCSIAPQSSTLSRAPIMMVVGIELHNRFNSYTIKIV
jgi:hypothetical protein